MKYTQRRRDNQRLRRHKLLTARLRQQLPELQATAEQADPIAWVKYFTPDSNWYWYGVEFDGEDIFYGLVFGHYEELGSFRLSELEEARGPMGLPIERDLFFQPAPLSEVRKQHHRREGVRG
jgi:hypothetical protein